MVLERLLRLAFLAGVLGCVTLGCTTPEPTTSSQQPPSQRASGRPAGLIAFVSDREGVEALYVMQADGTEVRRLTEELPPVSHPAWSTDGRRLAFNAGTPSTSDIYLISPDGSGLTQVTRDAAANFYPSWSPDGRRLAFSSNRDGDWDIFVMDVDGSNVRQLVNSPGWTTSRSGRRTARGSASRPPAEARPSSARSTRTPASRSRSSRSRSAASTGVDRRRLTAGVQRRDFGRLRHRRRGSGRNRAALVVAEPASEERPRWSPDGRWLAYYSDAQGSWDVYVVDVQTG